MCVFVCKIKLKSGLGFMVLNVLAKLCAIMWSLITFVTVSKGF